MLNPPFIQAEMVDLVRRERTEKKWGTGLGKEEPTHLEK